MFKYTLQPLGKESCGGSEVSVWGERLRMWGFAFFFFLKGARGHPGEGKRVPKRIKMCVAAKDEMIFLFSAPWFGTGLLRVGR